MLEAYVAAVVSSWVKWWSGGGPKLLFLGLLPKYGSTKLHYASLRSKFSSSCWGRTPLLDEEEAAAGH
jgi:hypothetical protein